MQTGDSSYSEPVARIQFSSAITASNALTEIPTITSIESEEYSDLSKRNSMETSALKEVTTREDSIRVCGTGQHEERRETSSGSKNSQPNKVHQDFVQGPDTPVSMNIPKKARSMPIQEPKRALESSSTDESITAHVFKDNEQKIRESKAVTNQRLKDILVVDDGNGNHERAKPKKVKSLSFLEDPSPTGIDDTTAHFGTPTYQNELEANNNPPPPCRVRGRSSKRANGKSKRSQTPAAPPINMSDYGSDDDIAANLVETVYTHSETQGRKKTATSKSALRNTKPHDARPHSNFRERSARRDNLGQKMRLPAQETSKKASTKARVSFELSESLDTNIDVPAPKIKCHTPFPRDTIDLLAASDSEDSDGIPLECRAKVSSKSHGSARTNDCTFVDSTTPFWMPEGRERLVFTNSQVPRPAKKVAFTLRPIATNSKRTTPPSAENSVQRVSFVRIGGPRNELTFERTTETLNIIPDLPYLQRPKLVPGSYCCTCGQNVTHL